MREAEEKVATLLLLKIGWQRALVEVAAQLLLSTYGPMYADTVKFKIDGMFPLLLCVAVENAVGVSSDAGP